MSQSTKLNEKQYHQVEQIRHAHRELDTADQLSQAFVLMLPERRDKDLDARLLQAEHCGIAERKSGCPPRRIRRDDAAVRAAFTSHRSHGQVGAQMHCLKRKPRHMSAERSLLCRGVVYCMSANFFRIFTEQGTADLGRLIFSGWLSWAHPQRDMGRLHRFLHGCEQFLPQLFQVHFAAQPCTESLDDFGRIIFAAVEAAINALLEAMA